MSAARTLPKKICPRCNERVRIVLSVPLWSSDATMSPATSAVISGSRKADAKVNSTSGIARPDWCTYAPKGTSLGRPLRNARLIVNASGTPMAANRPM